MGVRKKVCTGCGHSFPPTTKHFYPNRTKAVGLTPKCRECAKQTRRIWSKNNRAKANEAVTRWRRENPESAKAINSRAYAKRPIEDRRRRAKATREKLKSEILQAYGGPICVCCGEDEPLFLTLDHINGGGRQERLAAKGKLWAKLRKLGFPPGYQVLCFNCNCGRARNGGVCPHKCRRAKCVSKI